ncbi:E-selectin-like [Pelodytes ibericus]
MSNSPVWGSIPRVWWVLAGVQGWSYFYSPVNMTYMDARNYCRTYYTDIVAIQNRNENEHLNNILPFNPTYYWIGIRKMKNQWTWVGTNKILTEEAINWATNEPNNMKNNEDCVEMYVKRKYDQGKWNDESCLKKKVALCYTAACNNSSCSGHGECIETINNYTCKCNEGFFGAECEYVTTCEPLEDPENGSFQCLSPNGNFSYGAFCQFLCEEGYRMHSKNTVTCTATGWSSKAPTCQVSQCIDLKAPMNGVINCNGPFGDYKYNSTCHFSCDKGFQLVGNEALQCMATSQWNRMKPHCEAIWCPTITFPEQGSVTCSHVNWDFTYNSRCEFTCSDGFVLIGSKSIHCTAQGQWTDQTPHCEAIQCQRPLKPNYGTVDCSSSGDNLQENSTCEFECTEGFSLGGSASMRCVAPGQWTEEPPMCQVVSCPDILIPEQASMKCEDEFGKYQYNSKCSFTCNEGFILTGTELVQCSSSGSWSSDVPECQAVICPAFSVPEHASMDCEDEFGVFQYSSRCSFKCSEGFILIGPESLQCTLLGSWTSDVPKCQAISCTPLNDPLNGQMECQGESYYNSKCTFTCAQGFQLVGVSALQCLASGEWSASVPFCEALECEALMVPNMGIMNCTDPLGRFKYGSVCTFDCENDLLLNGTNTLECDHSGKWSAPLPTCQGKNILNDFVTIMTVGVVAAASCLSTVSLLIWLLKHVRKTAKKFTPSSSCQSLEAAGVYQNIEEYSHGFENMLAELP